jgi:hypothetical protein
LTFVLAVIVAMFRAAVPEFVRVTVIGWLVVPVTSSPKVRVVADKERLGEPLGIEPPPHPLESKHPQTINVKYLLMTASQYSACGPRGASEEDLRGNLRCNEDSVKRGQRGKRGREGREGVGSTSNVRSN